MTRLAEIGERGAIERFAKSFTAGENVTTGVGDDAAVVTPAWSPDTDLVLTSDALLEDVHFLRGDNDAKVGRKAIARCLSDLAAMGAVPAWGLINLVCRADHEVERLEQLCRGADELAMQTGLSIVGGDTTCADTFQVHVFCVGTLPRGTALLRSTGRPGDNVYVTGSLGGSIHGRHLTFDPRLEHGRWLREHGYASASIDISDGLAIDLVRLASASQCGVLLDASKIPVSSSIEEQDPERRLRHALGDGEDYELLFTVPDASRQEFEAAWAENFELNCTLIGTLQDASEGCRYLDPCGDTLPPLDETGYEHFRDQAFE
jgi:thiamine-monophosphate kinase